jgi:hypothetical protein
MMHFVYIRASFSDDFIDGQVKLRLTHFLKDWKSATAYFKVDVISICGASLFTIAPDPNRAKCVRSIQGKLLNENRKSKSFGPKQFILRTIRTMEDCCWSSMA